MNHTSLVRRLLAGAASLTVGAAGALALAAPASAQSDVEVQSFTMPVENDLDVTGSADCDPDSSTWTVMWTITNLSTIQATVFSLSSSIDGVELEKVVPAGVGITGTQTLPSGTESAALDVTLRWAWQLPPADGEQEGVWQQEWLDASGSVELGDCPREEPEDPKDPEDPEQPTDPAIVVFFTCDLLAFIIDNSEGAGEATVTFTANEPVTHGHASGFSYTIDDENNIEVATEEGAGIHEVLGEADPDPVVLGPFPAGADPHTHAFEAFDGLTVTVELTVDGKPAELEDNVVTWTAEGLDCGEDGEGGELPTTGSSTTLIAGGAVALLVLGGGLYLAARRHRVTFSA